METQIKSARHARGWSQLRVVVELECLGASRGVSMPTRASLKTQLSRWENGHVRPQEPYCSMLAEIYAVDCAELRIGAWSGSKVGSGTLLVPEAVHRLTPDSVAALESLLETYARADNAIGPGHLLHAAAHHVGQLEPLLVAARGRLRSEGLRLGSRFAEFAGWLCQDAGNLDAAQHWTDRALDFAEEFGSEQDRAYVLMRKSGIAAERGDRARSASLAVVACRHLERLTPRTRALMLRQQAVSQALVGDEAASERAADQAIEEVVDVAESDDAFGYCTEQYVTMETGVSALHLRKYDDAAGRLSRAAEEWPEGFTRDRGLCLARLATVQAVGGDRDGACVAGREALSVYGVAGSARTRSVLVSLNRQLAPYDREASVKELRHELRKLG